MRTTGVLTRVMFGRMLRRLPLCLLVLLLLTMGPAGPGHATAPSTLDGSPSRMGQACEPAALPPRDPELEALIAGVLGSQVDHYGVVVQALDRSAGAAVNPDRGFEAASLFKLGVMHEVFRQAAEGSLDFTQPLLITDEAATWDLGTLGTWAVPGQRITVERLLERMITISDNTAAVTLANRVGWHRIDPGLAEVGVCATLTRGPLRTTARDMAALLAAIGRGEAVSSEASAEMAALLLRQQIRDRIPAGTPVGVPVGNKTGNLPDATHDVAIVYAPTGPYVLAVLSDLPWTATPIVELSRRIYVYMQTLGSEERGPEHERPASPPDG